MCKELQVILVNRVVDPKRISGKKWRAKEEERHKGSMTQKKYLIWENLGRISSLCCFDQNFNKYLLTECH
jgi:hypothetical protein